MNENTQAVELGLAGVNPPTEVPAEVPPFFFNLSADENGVTELKFRKDASKLFATLLFSLDYVNQSFEEPFPTVGDFVRHLAEVADKVEAAQAQKEQLNVAIDPSTATAN